MQATTCYKKKENNIKNIITMATKRKTVKRSAEKKPLTATEYKKLFDYIGKARMLCNRIADNEAKRATVRTAMRSIEKKLYAIGNDYYWGKLTDYASGAY